MAQSYSQSQSESISESEAEWNSDSNSSQSENLSWIPWWCAHPGHEFFVEVPEEYIEDDFNMTGLSSQVPLYREALELILDLEPDSETFTEAADQATVEASSGIVYGLVHQRYLTSRNGLLAMAEKYDAGHFGLCPRNLCRKTPVLPIGLSDILDEDSVKLYCPSCMDVYNPPNSRFYGIDGAFFGTTFPHLFFMTFPELLPQCQGEVYVPKIYGFKVSSYARSGPRMTWLRECLRTEKDSDEDILSDDDDEELNDEAMPDKAADDSLAPQTNSKRAEAGKNTGLRNSQQPSHSIQHDHGTSVSDTRAAVVAVREPKIVNTRLAAAV